MVWEGVSGVKHIFLHIRRAMCAVRIHMHLERVYVV